MEKGRGKKSGTAFLGRKSWAKGAAFLVIRLGNVIQADPFPLGRSQVHRSLFQRRQLGKHCSYFIPNPPLGDTGPVLLGEREPQQHDGKHNPPCNVHTEWKPSHTARMPQQSRLPSPNTCSKVGNRRSQPGWEELDLFIPQNQKVLPRLEEELIFFLPCYEVISESHLFPSWGCLTTPRAVTAANRGSGAATAVNPEPWAGKRGAFDAKPHL